MSELELLHDERSQLRGFRSSLRTRRSAADVADLFNYLDLLGRPQRFRKLLVAVDAPLGADLRVRAVAEAASAGKKGRIRIKVNALTDQAIIEELHRRIAGRSRDRARHSQHLRSGPACRAQRQHSRPQRARPIPRAQSRLHFRGRKDDGSSPRQPGRYATSTTRSRVLPFLSRTAGPNGDQCLVRRLALRQRTGGSSA